MDDCSIFSYIESLEKDLGGDTNLSQIMIDIQRILDNRHRKTVV